MKFLLDTDTCVYLLNGSPSLKKKVEEVGVFSLAISNSVLAELYFGAYNSKKAEDNLKRINDQWRICFEWQNGSAHNVEITDYH
jgi:tRNA(fMet)-specific endonuclease VapC